MRPYLHPTQGFQAIYHVASLSTPIIANASDALTLKKA